MTLFAAGFWDVVGDVLGFFWDVVVFVWEHFFDILELLIVAVVVVLAVAVVAGVIAAARAVWDLTEGWRRPRGVRGSDPVTHQPVARGSQTHPALGEAPKQAARRPAAHGSKGRPVARDSYGAAGTAPAPARAATTAPGRARRPVPKCAAEKNKTVYTTQAKADAKVEQSKQRYALHGGQLPLDHSYRCPHADHWHVSSKQRY